MTEDLAQYLASKGLQVFRAAGAEVTVHCIFCSDGDPRGKGRLYLNSESWLYECKRCTTRGNRVTLLRHFGDSEEVAYLPGQDPLLRRRVLEDAVTLGVQMLANNDEICDYLVGRGLKAHTIRDYRLGYISDSWSLCSSLAEDLTVAAKISAGVMTAEGRDFFRDRILIPYLQHGSVVQLRGKDPHGKYFTPAGEGVRLFNADRLQGAEDVIITEGEFDTLVLQQVLELSADPRVRAIAVVGIPGAGSLPAGFESYFSQARRVYVGLDPDDTGKRGAIRIKELLGSKARIVELPEDLPKCDWTHYITNRGASLGDVMELIGTAAGRRLWSIGDAAAKWRKRQVEAPGIKTGFTELDSWFAPGFEAGDLVVPLAKTGTGKTQFLCSLAYNTRDIPSLFITMEMTAGQIYDRMRKIHHFYHPHSADADIEEGLGRLRIVDENRLAEGDISALCEEYADEMGERPQLVHVDYLGYYAKGCRGVGAYEKTTAAVMGLKAEAKSAMVAIVAPHQVNRAAEAGKPLSASDARDSGAVEETADLLLSLFRPDAAIQHGAEQVSSGLVRLQVLKNRKGPVGMASSLMFSSASLVLVEAGTPWARVAEEENRQMWRGLDYESVRLYRKNLPGSGGQLRLA